MPAIPPSAILLGSFFALAALMAGAAGASLLCPGESLDWIWAIKPDEYRQLLDLGPLPAFGFLAFAVLLVLASVGLFRRRSWSWRMALGLFVANAVGDAARIPLGAPGEGMFGIAVVIPILWWLTRPRVRALFDR
jgi:hypothetical protein